MRTFEILSVVLLLTLCGCARERSSRVVQAAEQAGAGPLDGVNVIDMRVWFNGHPQVAVRVDALCAPLRTNPTAAWPQTTEGRLCAAAKTTVGSLQVRRHPDNTGILPGWK